MLDAYGLENPSLCAVCLYGSAYMSQLPSSLLFFSLFLFHCFINYYKVQAATVISLDIISIIILIPLDLIITHVQVVLRQIKIELRIRT